MAISWDWLISVAIIIALILGFWASITHQTIGEILGSIRDFIEGIKEGGEDIVPYYEG